MGDMKKFSEKIQERLSRDLKERTEIASEVTRDMERLLGRKDRFEGIARHVLASVVYPRMQALSEEFDNSEVAGLDYVSLRCSCNFSHTQRFPATVKLGFSLLTGQDFGALDLHYSLSIFPIFMEFNGEDGRSFPLKTLNEEDVGGWVENKILEFLDTYLKLETHPTYQKENLVVDPVCGMKVPQAAAAKVEQEGKTFYFCSEACKANYLKRKQEIEKQRPKT